MSPNNPKPKKPRKPVIGVNLEVRQIFKGGEHGSTHVEKVFLLPRQKKTTINITEDGTVQVSFSTNLTKKKLKFVKRFLDSFEDEKKKYAEKLPIYRTNLKTWKRREKLSSFE